MCIKTLKSMTDKIVSSILLDSEACGVQWRRLSELNRLLKGFRSGELTVLSGKTGTGKTTFISEYSLDLAESGVKTLWGSFEISIPKLCKTLLAQFSRKSLRPHPHLIESYIDKFHKTIPIYFMESSSQTDVFNGLFKDMRRGVEDYGIQHIILDNLQFIVGTMGNSMSEKLHFQDKLVGKLRQFVNESNTHITLIAHARKENSSEILTINSLYGGCKLSQESDNILLLQYLESKNKKYIQVVKNRHDGTLGTMNLNFKYESLCYSNSKLKITLDDDTSFNDQLKVRQKAEY